MRIAAMALAVMALAGSAAVAQEPEHGSLDTLIQEAKAATPAMSAVTSATEKVVRTFMRTTPSACPCRLRVKLRNQGCIRRMPQSFINQEGGGMRLPGGGWVR